MKEDNIMRTAKGVSIEERIEKGLTKFFEIDQHERSSEYAFRKGSYISDCYIINKSGRLELVGYFVPN
jgi:hypothetical protein